MIRDTERVSDSKVVLMPSTAGHFVKRTPPAAAPHSKYSLLTHCNFHKDRLYETFAFGAVRLARIYDCSPTDVVPAF